MKKINLLIPVLVLFFTIFFTKSAFAACVTINVDFPADGNWPAGQTAKISCVGDDGTAGCIGSTAEIKPGEKKTLTQCTCPEDGGPAGSGCLVVESKPSQCTQPEAKKYENYCKSNGYTVNAVLTSSCPAAPTPSPVCNNPYCQHWPKKDGSPADTCTKNGKTYYKAYKECTVDGKPVDYPEQECGSLPACEIPETPSNTPTPTVPGGGPMCSRDCSTDAKVCEQATDGCTACLDDGAGGKTCQPPPGGGPTATPPGSGPTATPPGSGPTATPPASPPTATPVPPTPTPDFNEAMCKCDGMTVSQIIAGQPAVFTATAKVTGSDVTKAEAKQIEFLLSAGNN
ncbi:MAG TPA: hypothetical protein PLD54_02300, partial [Candidatus Levybacteria bacterium]|nr:hypothetical protein [Candidatus Levybacteria bacterium]